MDKLEQFIIDQKVQFEELRKPEEGWDRLANRLDKHTPDWSMYWKVAAVFFFASTVVLGFFLVNKSESSTVMADTSRGTFEEYYIDQINQKMTEYDQLVGDDQRDELYSELANFDSAYAELSTSFKQIGSEKLAEAMLENLRLRVLILNEQIELIKRGKGEEETYQSS